MDKNIHWVNKFSNTDKPDNLGRWERACYCNSLNIASVKMVMERKSVLYSSKTFFPCTADELPYHSTTHESFKEAKEWVEYQWDKFKMIIWE